MRRPRDRFEWAILAIITVLVAVIIGATVAMMASGEPTCPDGQEYVFSHNIIVGQVIVPQYVCREA